MQGWVGKIFRYRFFYLILFGTLFLSCRTVKDSHLYTNDSNQVLLPSLEPYVDLMSFQRAYSSFQLLREPDRYEFSKAIDIDSALLVSSMFQTNRVIDNLFIFEHEVYNNITDTTSQEKGYIVCRIKNGSVNPGNYTLAVISGLTLFITNLLGMPISKVDTSLELEVIIYNNSKEKVASYNAQGEGRAWLAMYYGYSDFGNPREETALYRKSSILAFRSAINNIKEQINKDAQNIMWNL